MKYTIIADSGCDLKTAYVQSSKLNFTTVPLFITIDGKDYIDDETLETRELLSVMKGSKGAPKTACPSPYVFAEEMRKGNENIICVTLSSKLSGSYNSARLAAETVGKEDPGKKIFVLDSLSASAGMAVIIQKLIELIECDLYSFGEIIKKIEKIRSGTRTRFLLHDLANLIKTGRMSKIKGIIASVLKIKLICGEKGAGEIEQFGKAIGTKKSLQLLSECPKDKVEAEGNGLTVAISHCHNEEDAGFLKSLLESRFGLKQIKILLMRGLASFYANDKGLVLAY